MKELPEGARVAILAACVVLLFASVAVASTRASPYAPNDWLFSHTYLADRAIEAERIPLNADLATKNGFGETRAEFSRQTGLDRMSMYATTMWHFWNGLPIHPALVATWSLLAGAAPEDAVRVPLGGAIVLVLLFATADLVLSRREGADPRLAVAAPLLAACASAPFVLHMRVMMPSESMVVLALLLHLLLRRALLADRAALPLAIGPVVLLPFWYYTVSYFAMVLFAGFLGVHLVLRATRRAPHLPPAAPLVVAALVPLAMTGALVLNGALESHVVLASQTGAVAPGEGVDYRSHLNREPWRSALLYAECALLLAPLAWLGLRVAARAWRRGGADPGPGIVAQWALGGALFAGVLDLAAGVSFLNRGVIYLTPVAALAALVVLPTRLAPRVLAAGCAVLLVATAVFVATATPTYSEADRAGFAWMDGAVDHDAVVYSSLDVASVLFRAHGYHDAVAFHPSTAVLDDVWYSEDPERAVSYVAGLDALVLRDNVVREGFEEFGPLREPIGEAAYAKFAASRDLNLVFDSGAIRTFTVDVDPARLS